MSIREIQQALAAAGFNPGPIDGIEGPKTRAALVAFQQARGLSTASDQWGATEAALRGTGGAGGGSADAQADARIAAENPTWAWLFNDPEVGPLLREGLPASQLEFRIKQTNWYRNKTDAERNYLALAATNPTEATRRLNNYDSITKYISNAAQYGLRVSFQSAADQFDRVVRGEIAPDALTQELRIMAKAAFPYLADQIDQGATVEAFFEPIRQSAAQVLGINPAEIKLGDAKWQSLMQFTDPKTNKRRLPSTDEVEARLRQDETFGFRKTANGRNAGFAAFDAVMTGFGF